MKPYYDDGRVTPDGAQKALGGFIRLDPGILSVDWAGIAERINDLVDGAATRHREKGSQ